MTIEFLFDITWTNLKFGRTLCYYNIYRIGDHLKIRFCFSARLQVALQVPVADAKGTVVTGLVVTSEADSPDKVQIILNEAKDGVGKWTKDTMFKRLKEV